VQGASCYLNKIEKKTMINEINTLASALGKMETKLAKQAEKHKKRVSELKSCLKEG